MSNDQEAKDLQKEIKELKDKLTEVNKHKETWFKKKEALNKQISEKIQELTGSKSKRNELTKGVRDLKSKRDQLNKQIAEKNAEINVLKKEHSKHKQEHDPKLSPSKLKKQIEGLEYKVETEPMGYDKEQKVMKNIKELKKKYEKVKDVGGGWEEIKKKLNEVKKLRKEANSYHKQLQDQAKTSQAFHENLIGDSEEIKAIKDKEREAYNKFIEYKEKFNILNKELKQHLDVNAEVKAANNEAVAAKKAADDRTAKKKLEETAKEVEEKIQKKKKLTTEDLLVLQSMGDKEDEEEKKSV